MKVKHSVKLSSSQLTELLVEYLGLPASTKASYNLRQAGDQRDTYQVFGDVELSYETELANVTNKQGSSATR